MEGYSHEDSDFDLAVFYDPFVRENEDDFLVAIESVAKQLSSRIQAAAYELDRTKMDYLIRGIDRSGKDTLIFFCGPVIGPRVKQYRQMIGEMIQALPKARRLKFFDTLADNLAMVDFYGQEKALERIPELNRTPAADLEDIYLQKRKGRWLAQRSSSFSSSRAGSD